MQNNSSKLTLLSLGCLANEFLKTFYIRLAIFLSISFKYLFNIFLLKISLYTPCVSWGALRF
jgi:hypothetical protein